MPEKMQPDEVRGEQFKSLMQMKEWQAVADTVEAFLKKWRGNLHHYDASKSLEDLGREREKWCLMSSALELLFKEINECIETFEKAEDERREKINKARKPRDSNPYRQGE